MKHDWRLLTRLLDEERSEADFDLVPYHRGLYDLGYEVARTVRDAPAGEGEVRLFRMLADCLRGKRAGMAG